MLHNLVDRKKLRQDIKSQRKALSSQVRKQASIDFSEHFIKWFEFWCQQHKSVIHRPLRVGVYSATAGELDLSSVISFLCEYNNTGNNIGCDIGCDIELYFPALHPVMPKYLQFRKVECIKAPNAGDGDKLEIKPQVLNKYAIYEPRYDPKNTMAPWLLDIVLMPLIACDSSGHRLGMGGGYYDRSFEFKNYLNDSLCLQSNGPVLIGCGYDFQLIDQLESSGWDVGLNVWVSPSKVLRF